MLFITRKPWKRWNLFPKIWISLNELSITLRTHYLDGGVKQRVTLPGGSIRVLPPLTYILYFLFSFLFLFSLSFYPSYLIFPLSFFISYSLTHTPIFYQLLFSYFTLFILSLSLILLFLFFLYYLFQQSKQSNFFHNITLNNVILIFKFFFYIINFYNINTGGYLTSYISSTGELKKRTTFSFSLISSVLYIWL